ncbi:MAG TPA: fibronectin type III domain-containing protein [Woeseiaceae bacterium]|jgi:hypothetical protein|nr:fibronectin type III domain-containing protein [Woeseiaceae bacterium]
MRNTALVLLILLLLGGCNESAQPITKIEDTTTVAPALPGSVTLSWQPPTENSDGSPLLDLAGYNIYFGTSSNSYDNQIQVDNPGLSTYVVENLIPDTYYFSATAFNSSGNESAFSEEVIKVVN